MCPMCVMHVDELQGCSHVQAVFPYLMANRMQSCTKLVCLFFSRVTCVSCCSPPLEMKPDWWPGDIPWQNVRSDMRTPEKKKEVPWTEGLRRIVISCYLHHGRLDLLPEFSIEHLPQISAEAAQQIQLQLERLQQQGGVMGRSVRGVEGEGGAEGMVEHAASGTQLTEAGGGEVFTVDTGIGNCDNSGMPTLADATLAEAAAKLQQVCVCVCMCVCLYAGVDTHTSVDCLIVV